VNAASGWIASSSPSRTGGLERLGALRPGVGDGAIEQRPTDTWPRDVEETAKHTIDQTGRQSIVGMTLERTIRSKSVRGPRLTQPTARSVPAAESRSIATSPGGWSDAAWSWSRSRSSGTLAAAMSFERSRQNWHQHQRGSPPSRKRASSAGQVPADNGRMSSSFTALTDRALTSRLDIVLKNINGTARLP
jgi:surface antigen